MKSYNACCPKCKNLLVFDIQIVRQRRMGIHAISNAVDVEVMRIVIHNQATVQMVVNQATQATFVIQVSNIIHLFFKFQ